MDRKEKLQIALEVLETEFPPLPRMTDELATTKAAIQAELDALPKRWPSCRDYSNKTIEVSRDGMAVIIKTDVNRPHDKLEYLSIAISESHAIDFGMACIKAGGGDVLDKAAVIAWLQEQKRDTDEIIAKLRAGGSLYGEFDYQKGKSMMADIFRRELGAGHVR